MGTVNRRRIAMIHIWKRAAGLIMSASIAAALSITSMAAAKSETRTPIHQRLHPGALGCAGGL